MPRGKSVLLSAEAEDIRQQRVRGGGGAEGEPPELSEVLVEMTERVSEAAGAREAAAAEGAPPAGGAEAPGAGPPDGQRPSSPERAPLLGSEAHEEGLLSLRRAMCGAQPGIAEVVLEASHFVDFALGAYGWCARSKHVSPFGYAAPRFDITTSPPRPLFVYDHGARGVWSLCCGCGASGAMRHCCCGITQCCSAVRRPRRPVHPLRVASATRAEGGPSKLISEHLTASHCREAWTSSLSTASPAST